MNSELTEVKNLADIISSIITVVGIIIGGVWTYIKFIKHRQDVSVLDLSLKLNFVKKIDENWIVELVAFIENKGLARENIDAQSFQFDVEYIRVNDKIENKVILDSEYQSNKLFFPHKLVTNPKRKTNNWLPSSWEKTFIEPKAKIKYSYIVAIPSDIIVVLFKSHFEYEGEDRISHSTQIVLSPPEEKTVPSEDKK